MTSRSIPQSITIGTAERSDLKELLALYLHLHPHDPEIAVEDIQFHWEAILANPLLRYVVARTDNCLVSTCALALIPNLTRGSRPYGLIENVVTHPNWRNRGIGTSVLHHALGLAWDSNCYKVMLLTGRSDEATLRFYEKAGLMTGVKTGLIAVPPH